MLDAEPLMLAHPHCSRAVGCSSAGDGFCNARPKKPVAGTCPATFASAVARPYCAACAFVAAISASLRNDITVTFLVR
jgi:hypothetical protein